jgi:hypothetical protein
MDNHVNVLQVVVANGQFLQQLLECISKHGGLEATGTEHVLVIDVIIMPEQGEDILILKVYLHLKVASIQFVLEAYIDVAAEIVLPVLGVLVT